MNFNYTVPSEDFTVSADIDLRTVFENMIYGSGDEKPRGVWVILQRLIRDERGVAIKSPYSYKLTGEGKNDDRGPSTTRTGFLCTEHLIRVLYKPASRMIMDELTTQTDVQPVTRDVVYICSKDAVHEHDGIVFINIDDNGNITNPVTVNKETNITKKYGKHADNGRIEFYACIIEEQK